MSKQALEELAPLIEATLSALTFGRQYAIIVLPDPNIPAAVFKLGTAEVH